MSRQRATDRLAPPEAPDDAPRSGGIDLSLGRRFGGIGLQLFKLQFRLIEQFAATLGRSVVTMMLQPGDHQLQMCHHRLGTTRSGLGFPTCRTLASDFSTQRSNLVAARIGVTHGNTRITIARSRAPE